MIDKATPHSSETCAFVKLWLGPPWDKVQTPTKSLNGMVSAGTARLTKREDTIRIRAREKGIIVVFRTCFIV
jgi:hypothetical protein